jgi:dihydrolipoamide dehydrogenase
VKVETVVIGAGPGGYAAAFLAADLGSRVAIVDPAEHPGGVCLYRGCIPSKALLHVAEVIGTSRRAAAWGVKFAEPAIDLDAMRAWKDSVVGKLTSGLGQLGRRREVDHVRGRARFRDARTLEVRTASGEDREIAFEHAIVATGSSPVMLPGLPRSERVMDSTTALELPDVPRRLLVIGGGYIGLELGTVYAALGSRVTVVEMQESLLPGVDADLVRPLARCLADELESIRLRTKVASANEVPGGLSVRFEGEGAGEERFDRVLVAIGRRPVTEGLGLERTAVELDASGFIRVDEQRRTAEPSIFAVGDVAGQPMLAHKAAHEGRTAARVIAGQKVAFEPAAIPAVVFTDPEVAWCGLTETEAARRGLRVEIARFPWAASGRATTLGRSEGLTKLVIAPATGRVLGVGVTGPGAGELIAEGVLAVEMAALASDLELSCHPHPTLSETLMEAAASFFGQATHVYRPRRADRSHAPD